MTPRITTYTGRVVNPLDLRQDDIHIDDIAHSLACTNRFAGHAKQPISVAQHSVFVSRLSNGHALQGLLHDAAEAYLGDVTKWVKHTPEFEAYRLAEARASRVILQRFGCQVDLAPDVEAADRLMVRFEHARAYGCVIDHPSYPAVTSEEAARIGTWHSWSWRAAERSFLCRFAYVVAC